MNSKYTTEEQSSLHFGGNLEKRDEQDQGTKYIVGCLKIQFFLISWELEIYEENILMVAFTYATCSDFLSCYSIDSVNW